MSMRKFRFGLWSVAGLLSLVQAAVVAPAAVAQESVSQESVAPEATGSEAATQTAALPADQLKFFETHIRPLLVERCWKCHGEEKHSGELRLDSRAGLLTGGESGPAFDPENAAASLLLEAVRYESFEMPPDGRLSDEELAHLETWVSQGAPWPGGAQVAAARPVKEKITAEDRNFWSFRPLVDPTVPGPAGDTWSRNDIDRFILQTLHQNNLQPAQEASRLALVRRVYFDLIGLPPSPDDIDRFLANQSPHAYEELVEELLQSPRYGEHWARFWLDLVRYAESDGYRKDDYRPEAWRYRDYVIQAFNADKPYDQFVREQLAADEMSLDSPETLAATGFLRHGIYEYNQRDALTQWQDMLNDITDTTADVFLGVGMGCARCHDHKFDPILQADYFRLQAFFSNVALKDVTVATPAAAAEYALKQEQWEAATADLRAKLDAMEASYRVELANSMVGMFPDDVQAMWAKAESDRTAYERQICHLVYYQVQDELTKLPTKFRGEEKKQWEALKAELAKFDELKPAPLATCRAIADYDTTPPPVFIPGKERLGEVLPGFLTIFAPEPVTPEMLPEVPASSGRRTALADWLTRPDHPLTTRVIVNRIWQQHFGMGIVPTPSDFGHLGEAPSHPELLDWLALRFVEQGWSLKWLHRELVLSATYRQQSVVENAAATLVDPANRLLWRAPLKRLVAEQVRDALLSATGELEQASGGPSQDAAGSRRRSIYTKVLRNQPDELLSVLDFPDRMRSVGDRNITTTPSQALLLINSEIAINRAQGLARRVEQSINGPLESQIRYAGRIVFGRDPDAEELELLTSFVRQSGELAEAPAVQIETIPETQVQGVVINGAERHPLELANRSALPSEDFTLEATVRLESLFPDANVRTILSQWDANTAHPGWSLGVTSTKSKYTPGNLILQLVGDNAAGALTYEVIPSGLILELNRPYRVAVSVAAANTEETGILFRVVDLVTHEERTAFQKHLVVADFHPELPLVIGGRAGSSTHQWSGHLGDVQVSLQALSLDQLSQAAELRTASPVTAWNFSTGSQPLVDTVHGWALSSAGPQGVNPALIDLCHVLLNSNEFLYVD